MAPLGATTCAYRNVIIVLATFGFLCMRWRTKAVRRAPVAVLMIDILHLSYSWIDDLRAYRRGHLSLILSGRLVACVYQRQSTTELFDPLFLLRFAWVGERSNSIGTGRGPFSLRSDSVSRRSSTH
jgi:hypothetical protein